MKKLFILILFCFAITVSAETSTVTLTAPREAGVGQKIPVAISVDTNRVAINAFDITITYPTTTAFQGYSEVGSIQKTWLTPPTQTPTGIHFTGIVSGGVEALYTPDTSGAQPLPLITLFFTSQETGSIPFTVSHSEILKNDGRGTPLIHNIKNAEVKISGKVSSALPDISTKDTTPPEPFIISHIPPNSSSGTPAMLTFFAHDRESGILNYHLKHGADSWTEVQSPLVIQKPLFSKKIIVRATDFNVNSREAEIEIPGYISLRILLTIGIIGIIGYYFAFIVKRKR